VRLTCSELNQDPAHKSKGQDVTWHAVKTHGKMELQFQSFFNLGTGMRWVVCLEPQPLHPVQEKRPRYSTINSTESPSSSAGKFSEPIADVTNRERTRIRVRVDQCVSATRAVEVAVLVCLRHSCNHVAGVGKP
jgi:hypothetical protein